MVLTPAKGLRRTAQHLALRSSSILWDLVPREEGRAQTLILLSSFFPQDLKLMTLRMVLENPLLLDLNLHVPSPIKSLQLEKEVEAKRTQNV